MKKILILTTFAFFIFSCMNEDKKEKAINEIKEAKKALSANTAALDTVAANKLLNKYDAFVVAFPKDTTSANMLFEAGRLATGIGQYGKAIKYWGDMREAYADYRLTSDAMFLQAFTYENSLQDKDNAKRYYLMFLQRYPNHELATSAKTALEQIDIPLEELVKKFQKQEGK